MLDIYLNTRKPLHYESWNNEHCNGRYVDGTVDGKETIVSGLAKLPCRSRMLQLQRIFRRNPVIAGA
jgi:hypothetical protein